ncbi:MAG: HlyD family secretion protein [Pseudomonadota bacterium]
MKKFMSTLFRPESLNAKRDRLSGSVSMRQSVRYSAFALASIVVVVALLLFLVFGEYARRQTATGHIVPTTGVVKVYPRQAGMLEELEIAEGVRVEAGQVLARISNRREQTGESDIDAQLAQQLQVSIEQLESKVTDEAKVADLDADRLSRQVDSTRSDIAQLQSQLATEDERLMLADARKNDFERLRKQGFVSEAQYKDQYQAWLDAKLRREETNRSLATQQAQLTDLLLQQQQLSGKWTSRLADLRNQLSELQQRLIDVESRREFAIVAPVAGKVTAIQAKPGQTLTPQLSLLTIIPTDAEFEAELYVPTRAVGFVQPGQQVRQQRPQIAAFVVSTNHIRLC